MDRVCHFEIPYGDKERLQKFYSEVFGWNFFDAPMEHEAPYTFAFSTEVDETTHMPREVGGINGGIYPRGDQGAQSPVIVLEVADCAQRMKDVQAGGGQVLFGPQQVGDMGVYAQVKDTEDNIIGLWQSLKS